MAISVANGNNWKQATASSNQYTNNVSTGNLMVLALGNGTGSQPTVADADGAWDTIGNLGSPGDGFGRVSVWYKRVVAGQNGTKPTVSLTGGGGVQVMSIIELTGNDATDILDGTPTADRGTGAGTVDPGAITFTVDGGFMVLVAGAVNSGFSTANTTMVDEEALTSTVFAYGADVLTDPPGAFNLTFSYSQAEAWWALGVVFKAAAEAPAGARNNLQRSRDRARRLV